MPCTGTLLATLAALLTTVAVAVPAEAADTAAVSGTVFEDVDRSGTPSAGEPVWAGAPLHLVDAAGRQVSSTLTDTAGGYAFAGVPAGDYTVVYDGRTWRDLRESWVPTTTGSLQPTTALSLTGAVRSDLGLRRIVRSTDGTPLSRVVGDDGLVVESYNDAVSAAEVEAALRAGARGREAASTVVRFDVGRTNVTTTSIAGQPGTWSGFSAAVQSTWLSWLEQGDASLSHEYGHAWSLFHTYVVQQDAELTAYLAARGITDDPRLGTSTAWTAQELVAEDYRQLLGSPSARLRPQTNAELPPAKDVAGLAEFLTTTFTAPPASSPPPAPAPSPAPSPSPAPTVGSVAMNPSDVRTTGTASFTLSGPARTTVEVLDGTGRTVRTLAVSDLPAGSHARTWDRRDDRGNRVRSGGYVLRVTASSSAGSSSGSAAFRVR